MNIEQSAANAKHRLICQHVCRWTKTYAMPCHVLKAMPDGRLKVLVFGERHWKGREHISRIRYVEAGRVEKVATEAVANCSNSPALRASDVMESK